VAETVSRECRPLPNMRAHQRRRGACCR